MQIQATINDLEHATGETEEYQRSRMKKHAMHCLGQCKRHWKYSGLGDAYGDAFRRQPDARTGGSTLTGAARKPRKAASDWPSYAEGARRARGWDSGALLRSHAPYTGGSTQQCR